MLPRFNARRSFLSVTCVLALLVTIANIHTYYYGQTTMETEESRPTTTPTPSAATPLPWYMKQGHRLPEPAPRGPSGRRLARLWPAEDRGNDRIENQLMFMPPEPPPPGKLKKVLMFNGLWKWGGLNEGQDAFAKCPVSSCILSANEKDAVDADAILFQDHLYHPSIQRPPPKQVWILYFLESPYHTTRVSHSNLVNWTATYRRDSDIVAPYEKWVYWDPHVTQFPGPLRDFAAGKTDKVAWFVSNCHAHNGRLEYAEELQKHIQVDIYGACGKLTCPRDSPHCFHLLDTKYKFYLAFENSNCRDYITEKFFVNGLGQNILPIVMGARPEDYAKVAPKNSYIHVDDFASPKHLAEFLHKLDKDDDLYNSYFQWKGTGEFINTHFFCRLCALLHDDFPIKSYTDINEWWRDSGTCVRGSWPKDN